MAGERRQGLVSLGSRLFGGRDGFLHARQGIAHVLQSLVGTLDVLQDAALGLGALSIQIARRILYFLDQRFTHRGDKGLVNLLLDRLRARIGHLGRNGILLLVAIILKLRLGKRTRKHAGKVGAEVIRNDDRCVVLAGLHALHGSIRVCKDPTKLVVFFKLGDGLIARVELSHVFVGRTLVVVGNGNLDICRVSVRVPVGNYVVPSVERRNDAYANSDNQSNGIFKQAQDIALENLKCLFH